jgi:hypothetical protein
MGSTGYLLIGVVTFLRWPVDCPRDKGVDLSEISRSFGALAKRMTRTRSESCSLAKNTLRVLDSLTLLTVRATDQAEGSYVEGCRGARRLAGPLPCLCIGSQLRRAGDLYGPLGPVGDPMRSDACQLRPTRPRWAPSCRLEGRGKCEWGQEALGPASHGISNQEGCSGRRGSGRRSGALPSRQSRYAVRRAGDHGPPASHQRWMGAPGGCCQPGCHHTSQPVRAAQPETPGRDPGTGDHAWTGSGASQRSRRSGAVGRPVRGRAVRTPGCGVGRDRELAAHGAHLGTRSRIAEAQTA